MQSAQSPDPTFWFYFLKSNISICHCQSFPQRMTLLFQGSPRHRKFKQTEPGYPLELYGFFAQRWIVFSQSCISHSLSLCWYLQLPPGFSTAPCLTSCKNLMPRCWNAAPAFSHGSMTAAAPSPPRVEPQTLWITRNPGTAAAQNIFFHFPPVLCLDADCCSFPRQSAMWRSQFCQPLVLCL